MASLTTMMNAPASAQGGPTPQQLLAESDAIRNPDKPFELSVRLTEYRAREQRDSSTLAVYAKLASKSGQYNSLVRIIEPVRDSNKLLLKNGNEIWLFDPASKASIRLSAQQRLLGQASNGDVVTVNLAQDYKAELAGEESILDGDKQPRTTYHLKLTGTSGDVTYHTIEYWLEKGTSRPVKARFYSVSGRLLKTAFYRRFENQLGRERPTEIIIIDGVDSNWITMMRYSDYRYREIPDSWLQRDSLSTFKD
ncbi:MAG: outer membrane lipoprotein-sorting protein [Burkholderiales bacterium]